MFKNYDIRFWVGGCPPSNCAFVLILFPDKDQNIRLIVRGRFYHSFTSQQICLQSVSILIDFSWTTQKEWYYLA